MYMYIYVYIYIYICICINVYMYRYVYTNLWNTWNKQTKWSTMHTVHIYVVDHAVVITIIFIMKDLHLPQSVSLFFSLYYIDSCFLDFYCEFSVFCFYVLCVSCCVFCCCAFVSFCVYTATPNPLQECPPHLGACRLPHYCTPLVCIPKFRRGLKVRLLYKPKPKPKPIDVSLRMHASP